MGQFHVKAKLPELPTLLTQAPIGHWSATAIVQLSQSI
jgi:hypothetical protein